MAAFAAGLITSAGAGTALGGEEIGGSASRDMALLASTEVGVGEEVGGIDPTRGAAGTGLGAGEDSATGLALA